MNLFPAVWKALAKAITPSYPRELPYCVHLIGMKENKKKTKKKTNPKALV